MVSEARLAATAWSWWQHLRSGGSTSWAEWALAPRSLSGDPPAGWAVPSAAALELARRAAARGTPPPGFAALVEAVTTRPGPGRGLASQPLRWPGEDEGGRIGPRAVDPSDVAEEELLRIGVGVLTDLLLRPGPTAPRPRRVLPRWGRGPSYVLGGAPVTTSAVRRALGRAGYAEGGPSPLAVLLAPPLDRALVEVWSARVQHGAAVRWRGLASRWAGRDALPPAADVVKQAEEWTARGVPVHVVTVGAGVDAAQGVAGLLGPSGHRPPRRRPSAERSLRPLSPAAVDAVRRVNAVLAVRADPDRHRAATRRLVASLPPAPSAAEDALAVPRPLQEWVHEQALAAAAALRSGRYPVLGRPEDVLPRAAGAPTRPARADVLTVVLDACLDRAKEL